MKASDLICAGDVTPGPERFIVAFCGKQAYLHVGDEVSVLTTPQNGFALLRHLDMTLHSIWRLSI